MPLKQNKLCSLTSQHEILLLLLSSSILIPLTRDIIGSASSKPTPDKDRLVEKSLHFRDKDNISAVEDRRGDKTRSVRHKLVGSLSKTTQNIFLLKAVDTKESHSKTKTSSNDSHIASKRTVRHAIKNQPELSNRSNTLTSGANNQPRVVVERAWRNFDGTGVWLSLNVDTTNSDCSCSNRLQLSVAVEESTERPCHCHPEGRIVPIADSCSWLFLSELSRHNNVAIQTPNRHIIQLEVAACHRAAVWCNCSEGSAINKESSKQKVMKLSKTVFQLPGVDMDKWQLKAAIHQLPREPLALEINLEPEKDRLSTEGSKRFQAYHWIRVYEDDVFSYKVPVLLKQRSRHTRSNSQPYKALQILRQAERHNTTTINQMSKRQHRTSKQRSSPASSYTTTELPNKFLGSKPEIAITSNKTSYVESMVYGTQLSSIVKKWKFTFSRVMVELYQCILRGNDSEHLNNGAVGRSDCSATRWRAFRLVTFSPVSGYQCVFGRDNTTSLNPGYYLIQVYPAVRWICHGANNGCRRFRYLTSLHSFKSSATNSNAVVHTNEHKVSLLALIVVATLLICSFSFVYWWRYHRRYKISRHYDVEESTCSTPLSSTMNDGEVINGSDSKYDSIYSETKTIDTHVILLVHNCDDPRFISNTISNTEVNHRWQYIQQIHATIEASGCHVLNVQAPSIKSSILAEPLDQLWSRLDPNIRILVVEPYIDSEELSDCRQIEQHISTSTHVFHLVLAWIANSDWANDYNRVFVLNVYQPRTEQLKTNDNKSPENTAEQTHNGDRFDKVNSELHDPPNKTATKKHNGGVLEKYVGKEVAVCLMRLVPACRYNWPNDQQLLIKSLTSRTSL